MNGLPYYKRFPRDFLEGTSNMTLELKGAYAVLLDLIYLKDGRLDDNPRWIAGNLGCSVRMWNRIKKELIEAGKIECKDGLVSNYRASNLLETSAKYQTNQRENIAKRWKNKGLPDTVVLPLRVTTDSDSKKERKKIVRATRFPDNFEPDIQFALDHGLTKKEALTEVDRMRDWSISAPGQKGVRADWPATWRNWIRRWSPPSKQNGGNGKIGYGETAERMINELREKREADSLSLDADVQLTLPPAERI